MNIRQIKCYLASKIGAKIVVIYYGSRNRKERYEGVVMNCNNESIGEKIKLKESTIRHAEQGYSLFGSGARDYLAKTINN